MGRVYLAVFVAGLSFVIARTIQRYYIQHEESGFAQPVTTKGEVEISADLLRVTLAKRAFLYPSAKEAYASCGIDAALVNQTEGVLTYSVSKPKVSHDFHESKIGASVSYKCDNRLTITFGLRMNVNPMPDIMQLMFSAGITDVDFVEFLISETAAHDAHARARNIAKAANKTRADEFARAMGLSVRAAKGYYGAGLEIPAGDAVVGGGMTYADESRGYEAEEFVVDSVPVEGLSSVRVPLSQMALSVKTKSFKPYVFQAFSPPTFKFSSSFQDVYHFTEVR